MAIVDDFTRILPTAFPHSVRGVRIAVIDDGVDGSHESLSNMIEVGRSFGDGGHYFVSNTGHGTAMASAISRVCPAARLYVAKLPPMKMARQFDVASMAEASLPCSCRCDRRC